MDLAQRIQAKTDNGDLIIDFLIEVMRSELDDFRLCHRLQAARLLTRHGWESPTAARHEAIDFIIDNPPELSGNSSNPGSSHDTFFDEALAKRIQDSTDDGATVCRFLINVMEGELKAFTPQHRISAARELLTRGFGKTGAQASRPQNEHKSDSHLATKAPSPLTGEGWSLPRTRYGGEAEEQEYEPPSAPSPTPSTQPTKSQESPNHKNHSNVTPYSDTGSDSDPEEQARLTEINKIIDDAIEESNRIIAEHPEQAPPYTPDFSAFDQAFENTQKWFEEWKNSMDPEEYRAIIKDLSANFDAKLERRIERRKQIAEERERRAQEEAERLAQQAEAESAGADESEEPPEPGPPTRSRHKNKLMFVLGESIYVDCGHPGCDLHEEDRTRFRGSVQYGAGPTSGYFP